MSLDNIISIYDCVLILTMKLMGTHIHQEHDFINIAMHLALTRLVTRPVEFEQHKVAVGTQYDQHIVKGVEE